MIFPPIFPGPGRSPFAFPHGGIRNQTPASSAPPDGVDTSAKSARLRPALVADAQLRADAFCKSAWEILGVRGSGGAIYGWQAEARRRMLGEPRLNRPYPDPALLAAGLPQALPLTVTTPFKWLLSPPLPLGDKILLPAQFEGGPSGFDGEELECRDLYIALRPASPSSRFVEFAHLLTGTPEYGYVYRSVGPPQTVAGSTEHFLVHLEEGTYSAGIFATHTHLYRVRDSEIVEVGRWAGHVPPSAEPVLQVAST